jgi:hypothetical protein
MEADSTSQSKSWCRVFADMAPSLSVALALAAGLGLRLWMLKQYFQVNFDSLVYGGLAKNLLQHGHYLLMRPNGEILPSLIRLPGYPLFLALCFRLFGMENYASAVWVQIALELVGCLLLADLVRRIASAHAAQWTLWLAALCPFTAIYAAEPLTESLTLFVIALALWSAVRFRERPGWGPALWFTFAVSYAALLRPDGALVGVALVPALMVGLWWRKRSAEAKIPAGQPRLLRMAVVCLLLALTPFGAWSWRNWQVFHVFQPLAPRYANDPDQTIYPGWQRWVKSWSLDFVSTFDVYWPVPGHPLELSKLPSRAFDSTAQYAETVALAADYNDRDGASDIVADVDERFGKLAEERIAAHPLRYYVGLPLGRVADMWLRPRVEIFYDDLDWWVYAHHPAETCLSWAYAGLNALYLLLGLAGLCLRPRFSTPRTKTCPWGPQFWSWMVAYIVLRSGLLMTLEAPEARYTLECFPMLFVLGGIGVCGGWRRICRAT